MPAAPATISAACESICLSTSHIETTSTGDTWIRRNRSHLPYQPGPMMPTRFGFWSASCSAKSSGGQTQAGGAGTQEFAAIHSLLHSRLRVWFRLVAKSSRDRRSLSSVNGIRCW